MHGSNFSFLEHQLDSSTVVPVRSVVRGELRSECDVECPVRVSRTWHCAEVDQSQPGHVAAVPPRNSAPSGGPRLRARGNGCPRDHSPPARPPVPALAPRRRRRRVPREVGWTDGRTGAGDLEKKYFCIVSYRTWMREERAPVAVQNQCPRSLTYQHLRCKVN